MASFARAVAFTRGGMNDYLAELAALADTLDMTMTDCARRYGVFTLRIGSDTEQGWYFHPALGLHRKRD